MRLLLWMSASLIAVFNSQNSLERVTHYTMAGGLPDGAILTFWMWHVGEKYYRTLPSGEHIRINFYDLPAVEMDKVYDVPAHFRLERAVKDPVVSASYVNGKWTGETSFPQITDDFPPAKGWWRFDVYKHDEYNLNVFFNGFWSGVRTFSQSLNGLKSAYVMPGNVDHNWVEIRIKLPNKNLPPMSVAHFNDYVKGYIKDLPEDKKLISFPNFPVHSVMEFTAVLRASGESRLRQPSLVFAPSDGSPFIFKVLQIWHGIKRPNDPLGEMETYITSNPNFQNFEEAGWVWEKTRDQKMADLPYTNRLTREHHNGDMQHFYLERSAHDLIKLRLFYKESEGVPGVYTYFKVPPYLAGKLDQRFEICSHDGAVLLHIDTSTRFLLLLAVLVAALASQLNIEPFGASYKLPYGLPDGSVITIYFRHKGNDGGFWSGPPKVPVSIHFYDQDTVNAEIDKTIDIPAAIRMEQSDKWPVASNTQVNGVWQEEQWVKTPLDVLWTIGWWRLDVIKLDEFRMNIFFQGMWSGIRAFRKSLNQLKSIYVLNSPFLEEGSIRIDLKMPSSRFPAVSAEDAKYFLRDSEVPTKKLVTLPSFPIGARIQMIAVIRASNGAYKKIPYLKFATDWSYAPFLRILQIWRGAGGIDVNYDYRESHELYLTVGDQEWVDNRPVGKNQTQCTSWPMRPNGDLLHFQLERVDRDTLEMTMYYKLVESIATVGQKHEMKCSIKTPLWEQMEEPFDILSHDGAFIFYMDHTIRPAKKRMISDPTLTPKTTENQVGRNMRKFPIVKSPYAISDAFPPPHRITHNEADNNELKFDNDYSREFNKKHGLKSNRVASRKLTKSEMML